VFAQIDVYINPMKKLGETLIESGIISKKDLYDSWIFQMREITLNIFQYFEGEFVFEEMDTIIDQEFEQKIGIPYLIEDGIRNMRTHPSLKSFFAKKVFVRKEEKYLHLLTAGDKKILDYVNGKASGEEIMEASNYGSELFWKSLYLVYSLDLIDYSGEKEAKQEVEIKKETILSAEEMETSERMDAMKTKLSSSNFYQIFDVPLDATVNEIKKAYFSLIRNYHPDSFDREINNEVMKKIEDVFSQLTEAYQTLKDEIKRKRYDSQLELPAEDDALPPTKLADVKFRQAKTLYERRRYDDALILVEEAVRIRSDKGSYFLLLALTESKMPALLKKAEKDFLKAIELEPWSTEAHVGLGLLYQKERLPARAKKQFQKALDQDPEHIIAMRELQKLGGGEKKKGWKSFLSSDFFGLKKK
jgi:curved DNA-binding protein CbpA